MATQTSHYHGTGDDHQLWMYNIGLINDVLLPESRDWAATIDKSIEALNHGYDDIPAGIETRPKDWFEKRGIRTKIAYKAFKLINGKLYPPQHPNANGAYTPLVKDRWLIAHDPGADKSVIRPRVMGGGKGTGNPKKSELAYRPGWHLGELPFAPQFRKTDKRTGRKAVWFPRDIVWCRCLIVADPELSKKYQEICDTNNEKYPMMGMQSLPVDGYYSMVTNKIDEGTEKWYITGAIRILKALKWSEVMRIMERKGGKPYLVEGDPVPPELANVKSLEQIETPFDDQIGVAVTSSGSIKIAFDKQPDDVVDDLLRQLEVPKTKQQLMAEPIYKTRSKSLGDSLLVRNSKGVEYCIRMSYNKMNGVVCKVERLGAKYYKKGTMPKPLPPEQTVGIETNK